MRFEIAPGQTAADGWSLEGGDWVKRDAENAPWVWDGEEMGVKDAETGGVLVERKDGVYLKDPATMELIARDDNGYWRFLDEEQPETAPPAPEAAVTPPAPKPENSDVRQAVIERRNSAPEPAALPPPPPPPEQPAAPTPPAKPLDQDSNVVTYPVTERYLRRLWCRDDGSIELRSSFRKYPRVADYDNALAEHLRQIQYICVRLIKAAQLSPNFTFADQVLCAVAITILDLFDPISAEIRKKPTAAIKETMHSLLTARDLELFEPMRKRARCLIKNRLECCTQQLEQLSRSSIYAADMCINRLAQALEGILYRLSIIVEEATEDLNQVPLIPLTTPQN